MDDIHVVKDRSSHRRCSEKKVFLEISQNSQENTGNYRNSQENYLKRDSGTGVFCEFCKISKNTFFIRTPLVAASACS